MPQLWASCAGEGQEAWAHQYPILDKDMAGPRNCIARVVVVVDALCDLCEVGSSIHNNLGRLVESAATSGRDDEVVAFAHAGSLHDAPPGADEGIEEPWEL